MEAKGTSPKTCRKTGSRAKKDETYGVNKTFENMLKSLQYHELQYHAAKSDALDAPLKYLILNQQIMNTSFT